MATGSEYLKEVKGRVNEIDPNEAFQIIDESEAGELYLLDVREQSEYDEGYIEGAVHVPRGSLETRIEAQIPDRDAHVIVYCSAGNRSALAADTLENALGYTNVESLAGGFQLWKDQGLPFEKPKVMSQSQKERYSRHILIPEIGSKGQDKLLQSKALLIGAGGLGSPAGLYLAAAGVGTVGIVDNDVVDLSNLQRQVIHNTTRIGEPKAESARQTIKALNPDVKVETYQTRLNAENVSEIIADYDVIVDGADNFPTRYLLNDAAVQLNRPVVHASILGFDGQLTVFKPDEGPCYRCLYPTPPPAELAPTCGANGVLGVLPGIMGLLQANEACKLIVGYGEPLVGRLLLFEALKTQFTELKVRKDPNCPVCSENAEGIDIKSIDYEEFCAVVA